MSTLFLLLRTVHDTVHDLQMKTNYSEPKIYTGSVEFSQWNKLSKQAQQEAVSKDWYVYFSFRNPKTGKLKRESNIKLDANRIKNPKERFEYLKFIQQNLSTILKRGYNPYHDNAELTNKYFNKSVKGVNTEILIPETEIVIENTAIVVVNEMSIREAFEFGLKNKINVLGKTSYTNYKGRINRFLSWLDSNSSSSNGISTLNKKILNDYLNSVLENSGATNRNNTRADLSSLIQLLVDNDIMTTNFVKSISILKSTPERNKTYSVKQESDILTYLEENDPILLLYIQFITYNFLRPLLRGRDVKRYSYEYADLYIIATFPSLKIDIEEYPAVKQHLMSYGYDRIKQTGEEGARKKTSNQWFETQDSISYWEDFFKQKIVWGNLNLRASYAIAESGMFINAPSPIIVPANKYLLATLNSKLADYYIRSLGVTRNCGYFEYKPMFIEKLPVPQLAENLQSEFISLTDTVINAIKQNKNTYQIEKEIDNLVYNLYGLNEDEISFIEGLSL